MRHEDSAARRHPILAVVAWRIPATQGGPKMSFQRGALILVALVAFAGCGSGEQMTISLYGEGTGDGDIWITNDEDQAVVGSMDASITMEGRLAADSHVELIATAHPGSHFVS